MLNKDICKKCINENRKKYVFQDPNFLVEASEAYEKGTIPYGTITEVKCKWNQQHKGSISFISLYNRKLIYDDDKNWAKDRVWCNRSFIANINEDPPDYCLYKLEHILKNQE